MKSYFTFLALFFSSFAWCQKDSTSFSGKIVDASSQQSLTAAKLTMGEQTFSPDANGVFAIKVPSDVANTSSLTVTCEGYKPQRILHPNPETFIYLMLFKEIKEPLPEVVVSTGASELVLKAIRKIPSNYYIKPVNQITYIQTSVVADDSAYRYKDQALLNVYLPSYADKSEGQVELLQNRKWKKDYDSSVAVKDRINNISFLNIYNLAHKFDFVFAHYSPIDTTQWLRYNYDITGTGEFDGHKVIYISFSEKDSTKAGYTGTLMIDSATSAIVNVNEVTNAGMRKLMTKKNKGTDFFREDQVAYSWNGEKWVLRNIHSVGYVNKKAKGTVHQLSFAEDIFPFDLFTEDTEEISADQRVNPQLRLEYFNKPAEAGGWDDIDEWLDSDAFLSAFPWMKAQGLK